MYLHIEYSHRIMTHYYEKTIIEQREFFTTTLINILTPFIYEGILSMYIHAIECDKKMVANGGKILSPHKTFQDNLQNITSLNEEKIQNELERIKAGSKCSDIFEDLIKGVIKSNIILLTFKANAKKSEIVEARHHEHVSIAHFIHKCYIISASAFYNLPALFIHTLPPLTVKNNQNEICKIIKESINDAIRHMLPMKLILNEYLQNDYMQDEEIINVNITKDEYERIKYLLEESKKIDDIKNVTAPGRGMNYAHVYDHGPAFNHNKHNLIFQTSDSSDFIDDKLFDGGNTPQINVIKLNNVNGVNNVTRESGHHPSGPKIFDVASDDVDKIIASQRKEMNREDSKEDTRGGERREDGRGDKRDESHNNNGVQVEYIDMEEGGTKKHNTFNFLGDTRTKLASKFGIVIDNHNKGSQHNDSNQDNQSKQDHDKEKYFARYKRSE